MILTDEHMKWFNSFWTYVGTGLYQKFIRDLQRDKSAEEIKNINRMIREVYVNQIEHDLFELGELRLANDDSTIFVQRVDELKKLEPTCVRLMVGNHGPYVEFTEPENKGTFIKTCLQYNWYNKFGMKLYEQFKGVNYADYKEGMWYVSLYQLLKQSEPCLWEYGKQ